MIDEEHPSFVNLRGLRQSGKTTLAKRLIAERVASGLGRRTCFLTLQTVTTSDRTNELDQYLGEYIRSGGLPVPVTDLLSDGRLAEGTAIELWRGLSADARRLARSDTVLRKLITRTVVALSSTTDWTTLTEELDVTRPTVTSYVDLLATSFALIVVHQRDQKRQGGAALRRPRKLYLGDPALASIPGALGGPTPSEGGLVENALAIARESARRISSTRRGTL